MVGWKQGQSSHLTIPEGHLGDLALCHDTLWSASDSSCLDQRKHHIRLMLCHGVYSACY